MSTELIPFGKYKGQPIEILQQDRNYCEWLMGQDWLQSRFPQLRTIIINNFAEPSETPEHNALQAQFLDEAIKAAVLRAVLGGRFPSTHVLDAAKHVGVTFESDGADVVFNIDHRVIDALVGHEDAYLFKQYAQKKIELAENKVHNTQAALRRADESLAYARQLSEGNGMGVYGPDYYRNNVIPELERKQNEAAVKLNTALADREAMLCATALRVSIEMPPVALELKPTMGDDYPAVLRQVRAIAIKYAQRAVVIGAYTGTGATLDQVRAMFYASGVHLLLVSDLEAEAARIRGAESMDARVANLLAELDTVGLTLTLDPPETLRLRGSRDAIDRFKPRVLDLKPAILAALQAPVSLADPIGQIEI